MEQEIEMRLWEYIDGICSETEGQRIALLIKEDVAWAEKYTALIAFNAELAGSLELDQPSMRFTKNVMEAVAATHIAPATKKYINPFIIMGIAAFFILIIAAVIGYVIATADYTSKAGSLLSGLKYPNLGISDLFSGTFVKVFVMVNIVLALMLADGVLRRKQQTG